ncbi:hypothetical protein LPJ60_003960, partial [Coemansia sp. RSA 2675]
MTTLHLERPMFLPGSAQSSGTYNEAKVSESLGTIQGVEHSPSSSRTLNSERRGKSQHRKDDNRKHIEAGAQALTVATFLAEGEAAAYADRCATHPGSRNDLWCETCAAAICSHCVSPATGSHRAHAAVKLAAAYDDAFEAIEALQLHLVGNLGETRQRNALLDEASAAVAEEFSAALAAVDLQAQQGAGRVEAARARAEGELVRLSDECMGWRRGLEGALGAVQRMVEELAPAQAVAERPRIERMLRAAAAARPSDWDDELPQPRIADQAAPGWQYSTLHVACVAELGRRRGHVHVVGDAFSAHGAVWQARVSRSRTSVGEPSLALAIACVEGPSAKRAFRVSASVAAAGIALTHAGEWAQGSEHVFSLCLLEAIAPALDGDGGLRVRVGVQPESYRELALAQEARIDDLEGRLRAVQAELAAAKADATSLSAEPTARRRRSEARGWATSPRAPPVPQIPLPAPPAAGDEGTQHRRAASLTAKLRRQPPIPFPISAAASEQPSSPPAGSVYSQSSGLSDEKTSVMRRLSGWVRKPRAPRPEPPGDDVGGDWTFLDRTLSPGFEQLAASAEPLRPLASSASASPLSLRIGRRPLSLWPSRGLINVSPPLVPVPAPLPPALPEQQAQQLGDAEDLADGFAFDGVADIEREQALVDARAERRAQAVLSIEDKYTSLAQRLDKIQLIANTCENSRDGFSEGSLRRISSELGVLMGSRRRQRIDAGSPMRRAALDASDLFSEPASDEESLCLSPMTGGRHGRRAVTMDSRELGRAIERSVALGSPEDAYETGVSPTPVRRREMAVTRRTSNSSVSSASSAGGGGRSSGRITRPGGGSQRRGSITGESAGLLGLSPAITPSKLGAIQNGSQLTPRANRQGGILKPGRTMRAKPGRLHTLAEVAGEMSAPAQPWVEQPSSPVTRATRSSSVAEDDVVREVTGRLARPNRALRKSVRFPEELRLLETIRLIDPRAAQTIENRAVSVYEPLSTPLPSDDESVPLTGLAARIRYSPRLAPKVLPDVEALSLDEAVDHLLLDAPHYARPPLPPRGSAELGLSRQRRNSASRGQRDCVDASRLVWGAGRGSMYVGPNVASAQSSPLDVDPVGPAAGSVSSLESTAGLVAGATHSAHLYPSELAAFGDAQIPAIACGRDTAFRASELGLVQGPDMKTNLHERLSNYKLTELRADLSHLTDGDKQALVKLADVSDLLNSAYYQQIWTGAPRLRQQLTQEAHVNGTEEARERLTLFELFKGPWDRSFENEPFIDSVGPKPKSANVYPESMTKEEFAAWVDTLGEAERKRAHGFYDVVKRREGRLELASYADEYRAHLEPAARLMREAAELVSDESFARFLRLRGDAFESNRYLESEVAWLNISHTSALEAAVGPYETYEDELFSAKAFFESMVHVRDFEGTKMLDKFTSSLELVERHLPIPEQYRNRELVPPPIVVVNQVYNGGDTAVPMTAAYNLPNDEEAIEMGGSKLTLIRNVQLGKVRSVLEPIARVVLSDEDQGYVTFDAFFTHVLLHEVAHSNGPHRVLGSRDTVRSRLQDLHSAFEEAKADIAGLFAAQLLIDQGVIDDISARQFYTTYLASAFRSVRFGLAEAHGLGQAMQLSYLLEH